MVTGFNSLPKMLEASSLDTCVPYVQHLCSQKTGRKCCRTPAAVKAIVLQCKSGLLLLLLNKALPGKETQQPSSVQNAYKHMSKLCKLCLKACIPFIASLVLAAYLFCVCVSACSCRRR